MEKIVLEWSSTSGCVGFSKELLVCVTNSDSPHTLEWVEWLIRGRKRRTEWARAMECRASEWNRGRQGKNPQWDRVSIGSLSAVCLLHFFFPFPFPFFILFLWGSEGGGGQEAPLSETAELVQPSHLTGPKTSLCCCECQSKRSTRQGLPWVTLHRLVRACEMDNSLGGLSGLMTRFPGICAAVPWPGSPSKDLCYGAVLPLYCYCYRCYGSTGG